MKILVVGSGGREHALCWAIAGSPLCDALWCAPGNAGIALDAVCVPIASDDPAGLLSFIGEQGIEFVVIGAEGPLAAGLVDALDAAGVKSFGPTKAAAMLESSKSFTKDFCARHAIPTAAARVFDALDPALDYVRDRAAPIVVKADGLAAGKGVVVARNSAEAQAALVALFGAGEGARAGVCVVIEEFLEGEEVSFFALSDGVHSVPLATALDHKRAGEGDTGPNTGGMGACSPAPAVDAAMAERIMATIIEPTIRGMAAESRPFRGLLYAGLMLTAEGPKLIEYNVRFGDPECQALIARLQSDLLPALIACADRQLRHIDLRWSDEAAVCVVMAAKGYPGDYRQGDVICGLGGAAGPGVQIFHAATRIGQDGAFCADGGRVLGVTARGPDIGSARKAAYHAVDRIDWPGGFCRRDIASRVL